MSLQKIKSSGLSSDPKILGVSSYQLVDTLPEDLKLFLPTSEEIAERLRVFDAN